MYKRSAALLGLTLAAVVIAIAGMVWAMLAAPRFFTGEPEAFYTPASAQAPVLEAGDVSDLDPNAPMPDPQVLTATLDGILADKPDGTSFSAQVVDVATGEVLYDRQAQQPGVPASSLKVVTALAALDTFGADHEFSTSTWLDGTTLVLRGGGDVLLGDGDSDPDAVLGRAGLASLAEDTGRKLQELGVSTVQLWLDDSLFGTANTNPAWDKSLFTSNNIAPVYPLAQWAGRSGPQKGSVYQDDAAQAARTAFTAALSDYVQVEQGGRGAHEGGEQLAEVHGAPLGDVIHRMLLVSDNYIAETLGRLVALERSLPADQAGAAVAAAAEEHGADNVQLVDSSGLAAANRISPAALTAVLRAAAQSPDAGLRELAYSLPISGYSGTLASRLSSPADRGLIRAKTGSLTGVATLTGLSVTDDGRLIAFSIFAHQPNGVLAPHKPTIDQAVAALHGCGCQGE